MWNNHSYYYEDVVFQLEINLQNIRRELIRLLDDQDNKECYTCNRLRCTCQTEYPIMASWSSQINDKDSGIFDIKPPPPESLPTPTWNTIFTSVENWIKASINEFSFPKSGLTFPLPEKVLNKVNLMWPPFKKSIWSKEVCEQVKVKKRENRIGRIGEERNNVAEFFKYFGRKNKMFQF